MQRNCYDHGKKGKKRSLNIKAKIIKKNYKEKQTEGDNESRKWKEYWSFIKRQTSDISSDNEWYNEWQWTTTSDNKWLQVVQKLTTSDSEWHNESFG